MDSCQVVHTWWSSQILLTYYKEVKSKAVLGSCSIASSGNFPGSLMKIPDFNVGAIYEDRDQTLLNSMINSELSLAAGSLPTGANSAVLKGLNHLDLPTPSWCQLIFNCSGSSTAPCLIAEEDAHLGQTRSQKLKRKHQQGVLSTTFQSDLFNWCCVVSLLPWVLL